MNSFLNPESSINKIKDNNLRFAFADGLRGLSALWVVFFHLSEGHHIDKLKAYFPPTLSAVLFDSGHLGVATFFVLSGYVMAYTVHQYDVDLRFSAKFILRRLIRLSPPYYFAILVSIAFLWLKSKVTGGVASFPNEIGLASHLLYFQGFLKIPLLNTVFWTLCIEVQFYLAFVVMVFFSDWLTKRFKFANARLYTICIFALLAPPWAFGFILTPIWQGGFITFWYSFMVGVSVSWAVSSRDKSFIIFSVIMVFLVLIAGFTTLQGFPLMVTFSAAIILYAGLYGKMSTWLNWQWLQGLGLISYSLYLLHNPITGAVANLIRRFYAEGIVTDLIISATTLIACVLSAWMAFKFIERPSIRWSHTVSPTKTGRKSDKI